MTNKLSEMNNKKLRGTNVVAERRLSIWQIFFKDTQRTLAIWKYYKIYFCLHMDICLQFCICIWITWNNFKMFKSFKDCLLVLKIVYFVPTKLLNQKILCWKQMEFTQSNISLFDRNTLLKSYGLEWICWKVMDSLFVTQHCWINDQLLKGYIHVETK